MKKFTVFFIAFVLLANLVGCSIEDEEKEFYRTDTVIYIPAEPTETVTEAVTEPSVAEETAESSEEETTEESVPETTKSAANKTSSGTKKPTSSSSSKKPAADATTAPTTEPTTAPVTEATTEATTAPTTEATTEATTEPAEVETTSEPMVEETTEETTIPEETAVPEETAPTLYDISGYEVGKLEKAMMNEINRYRSEENLGELRKSSKLSAIASARAFEVMQHWSHTRPDGTDYTTVFRDYGYGCTISAENLIYTSGGEDAAALVSRWMEAEGNRKDLMDPAFTHVGIGIYEVDGYVYIACLLAG